MRGQPSGRVGYQQPFPENITVASSLARERYHLFGEELGAVRGGGGATPMAVRKSARLIEANLASIVVVEAGGRASSLRPFAANHTRAHGSGMMRGPRAARLAADQLGDRVEERAGGAHLGES